MARKRCFLRSAKRTTRPRSFTCARVSAKSRGGRIIMAMRPRWFCAATSCHRWTRITAAQYDMSAGLEMTLATPEKRLHNRDIEALCAAKGMRMTGQRRTIARVLAESEDHPDVEELYRRCSKVDQQISISTVY